LAVLGAGSWGTALAILIARRDRPVLLWDHNPEHVAALKKERRNTRYLPDFELPDPIIPTADLSSLATQTRDFVITVPSHAFRATLSALREALPELDHDCRFCWGTKGLEATSGKLLNEVFDEVIGQSAIRSALSGPSFAREVAAHLPTALTVAADDPAEAERFAGWFRWFPFPVWMGLPWFNFSTAFAKIRILEAATRCSTCTACLLAVRWNDARWVPWASCPTSVPRLFCS